MPWHVSWLTLNFEMSCGEKERGSLKNARFAWKKWKTLGEKYIFIKQCQRKTSIILTEMNLFSVEDYLRILSSLLRLFFLALAQRLFSLWSSGWTFLISVEWSTVCSGNARLSLVAQERTRFVLTSASCQLNFMVLLCCLPYPCRLFDMVEDFGFWGSLSL